jgi:hypothetical protein
MLTDKQHTRCDTDTTNYEDYEYEMRASEWDRDREKYWVKWWDVACCALSKCRTTCMSHIVCFIFYTFGWTDGEDEKRRIKKNACKDEI